MGARRTEALDGIRGLAALAFAISGVLALGGHGFAWRFGLGADVLILFAGFVTARAHRPALEAGLGYSRFLISRIVRVAPLNAAIVAALLCFATVGAVIATGRGPDFGAADAEGFVATLALVQLLVPGAEAWSPAGWLLSAELLGSLLLAALCRLGVTTQAPGRLALFALILLAVGARLGAGLTPTEDLAARAFADFFSGVLLHALLVSERARAALKRAKTRAGTALEVWAALALLGFAALAPETTALLAPLAAMGPLFVFLRRGGRLSELLESWAAQVLGRRATSLAVCHPLAFPAYGALGALGVLVIALALANAIWREVEWPTQRAMWAWLDRRLPEPGAIPNRR